jgi:hypothetical protein
MNRILVFLGSRVIDREESLLYAQSLCPEAYVVDIATCTPFVTPQLLEDFLQDCAEHSRNNMVFITGEVHARSLDMLAYFPGFYACYVHTLGAPVSGGLGTHTYAHHVIVRTSNREIFEEAIHNFIFGSSADLNKSFGDPYQP